MKNSYLRWQETGREEGISIPWQNITLHAISSEPVKCIYIMLDNHVDYPTNLANGNGQRMANDPNDDDDDEGTCEGKFTCNESFLFSFFYLKKTKQNKKQHQQQQIFDKIRIFRF